MIKRIKKFIGLPEKREYKETDWEITVLNDGEYLLKWPYYIAKNRAKFIFNRSSAKKQMREDYSTWADIQIKVLSGIQQYYINPHTYMRLYTYHIPKDLLALSTECQIEMLPTQKKDRYLYLIPDCQDKRVWKAFLETGTAWHVGRTLFTLNYEPDNWKEATFSMFEIAQQLFNLRPISEFKSELERCCLLCYSMLDDGALVIAKAELPESTLISIIDNVAHEEGLELKIQKERNYKNKSAS